MICFNMHGCMHTCIHACIDACVSWTFCASSTHPTTTFTTDKGGHPATQPPLPTGGFLCMGERGEGAAQNPGTYNKYMYIYIYIFISLIAYSRLPVLPTNSPQQNTSGPLQPTTEHQRGAPARGPRPATSCSGSNNIPRKR